MCGEHSPCSGHIGFAPYRGVCVFPVYIAQAPGCAIWSGPCVECGSSFRVLHNSADSVAPAFCAFPGLSGSGSQRLPWVRPASPWVWPAFSLRSPSACLWSWFVLGSWPLAATLPAADVDHPESQEFFRWDPGPVCSVGGGGFSGAEFSPFLSPLPPTSSGAGPALLWSFSVPLFCEWPAVCSGQLVFSLALPQFKRAPSDCSQGLRAGPYPKQCRRFFSVQPPLAGGGCGRLGYFSAGDAFRHVICGPYLISPPS